MTVSGFLCTPWLEHAHIDKFSWRVSMTFHVETWPSIHPITKSYRKCENMQAIAVRGEGAMRDGAGRAVTDLQQI